MLINVTLKVTSGLCPWPFPHLYQLLEFKKKMRKRANQVCK